MKRLLATTAIVTSMAFAGGAFAQEAPTEILTGDEALADTLLQQILNDVDDVTISMLNAAENLANLNASITIDEATTLSELLDTFTGSLNLNNTLLNVGPVYTWTVDGEVFQGDQDDYQDAVDALASDTVVLTDYDDVTNTATWTVDGSEPQTGTLAQFNAAVAAATNDAEVELVSVIGGDLIEGLLRGVSIANGDTIAVDFFDPATLAAALVTTSSDLATTVIGALNTGVIGQNAGEGVINPTLLNLGGAVEESVAQTTGTLAASATYSELVGIQLANVAQNAANSLDGSINVTQLLAQVDGATTTMIGALNTGDIATSVTSNITGLTEAIVGN